MKFFGVKSCVFRLCCLFQKDWSNVCNNPSRVTKGRKALLTLDENLSFKFVVWTTTYHLVALINLKLKPLFKTKHAARTS